MTEPLELKVALAQAEADYKQEVADIWADYAGQSGTEPPIDPPIDPPPGEFVPPNLADYTAVADGQFVTVAGMKWQAQCGTNDNSIAVNKTDANDILFRAVSGENASFDPDRKIRSELGCYDTFGKGEVMALKGRWTIHPNCSIKGSEWCTVIQVHQADTRHADGVPVQSSPAFSLDIIVKNGQPHLQVTANTSTGVPPANWWPPMRILAVVPITLGVEHEFDVEFVDGHGYDGSVNVSIDGVEIVDFVGPTGYEYVDLLQDAYLVNGKPQSNESYFKMGIYAGVGSGNAPPPDVYIGYRFRF
jgi:hypothetical protein